MDLIRDNVDLAYRSLTSYGSSSLTFTTFEDNLDDLFDELIGKHGENKGRKYLQEYANSFPLGYLDEYMPRKPITDIKHFVWISDSESQTLFYWFRKKKFVEKMRFFNILLLTVRIRRHFLVYLKHEKTYKNNEITHIY